MKHVETGTTELCLVNVNGTLSVLLDRCPHMNALLSMGILQGTIVTCPLHYSRFDVTTGRKISGPVFPQPEVLKSSRRTTWTTSPGSPG